MIPKYIIEKAMEGGWRKDILEGYFFDKSQKSKYNNGFVLSSNNQKGEKFVGYEFNFNDLIVDPLFWEAIGKMKGWEYPYRHAHNLFDILMLRGNTSAFWKSISDKK